MSEGKSGCPINMTVELLGDRWSLVVLRDIIFGDRRRFRELMGHSMEGIASNILAARLAKLVGAGLLTRHEDPHHKQRVEYRLTEASIQLVPVFAQLGAWGNRWLPTSPELSIRAQLLADGGAQMWEQFMEELRSAHLSDATSGAASAASAGGVLDRLTAAHDEVARAQTADGRGPAVR